MATSLRYILIDYWAEVGDPRLSGYPLLSQSVIPVLAIMTLYVVLVKWIGPSLMRNQKPFDLKPIILLYNLTNVLVNVYFFFRVVKLLGFGVKLVNFEMAPRNRLDDFEQACINFGAWFLAAKIFDMLETVFFVMRHKQSQVSFLHVYHHAVVPFCVWTYIKMAPTSGPSGFFPLLNSAIHAIMYTYYFMAALGPQYQPYLWWKRYITTLQLAQFVLLFLYSILLITFQSGFPKFYAYLPLTQAVLFFKLFFDFYQKTYDRRSNDNTSDNKAKTL